MPFCGYIQISEINFLMFRDREIIKDSFLAFLHKEDLYRKKENFSNYYVARMTDFPKKI